MTALLEEGPHLRGREGGTLHLAANTVGILDLQGDTHLKDQNIGGQGHPGGMSDHALQKGMTKIVGIRSRDQGHHRGGETRHQEIEGGRVRHAEIERPTEGSKKRKSTPIFRRGKKSSMSMIKRSSGMASSGSPKRRLRWKTSIPSSMVCFVSS